MRIDPVPLALASRGAAPAVRGGVVLGTRRREGSGRVVEWVEGTGS
ncbi:MAG: hypothetical protein J0H73_00815 [Salana multivorans]|nr:hypothetical protein [Salana multivorans]MBN8880842.1 hypothetical protein [Salana multivorans]